MKSIIPVACVILGVLLLVMGLLWGTLFPPQAGWSPEKNTQLTELGSQLKGLGFKLAEAQGNPSMQRGENPAEIKRKHDEVKKEYDALYAEFESARDRPANTGSALKWVGVIIAAIGGIFAFVGNKEG